MKYVQGYSRKKAVEKWKKALTDNNTFKTKENGATVVAVRLPTEVAQTDIFRSTNRFKGEKLAMGNDAAESLLTGKGPKASKSGMKAITGTQKVFDDKGSDESAAEGACHSDEEVSGETVSTNGSNESSSSDVEASAPDPPRNG